MSLCIWQCLYINSKTGNNVVKVKSKFFLSQPTPSLPTQNRSNISRILNYFETCIASTWHCIYITINAKLYWYYIVKMKGKNVGLLSDFQVYTVDYPSTSDLRDNTIFTLLTSHHRRPLTKPIMRHNKWWSVYNLSSCNCSADFTIYPQFWGPSCIHFLNFAFTCTLVCTTLLWRFSQIYAQWKQSTKTL